jgi:hypothetical protein
MNLGGAKKRVSSVEKPIAVAKNPNMLDSAKYQKPK